MVRRIGHRRESGLAERFHRRVLAEVAQIELDVLREARQVGDAQERRLTIHRTDERQHVWVVRIEEFELAAPEDRPPLPERDQLAHP